MTDIDLKICNTTDIDLKICNTTDIDLKICNTTDIDLTRNVLKILLDTFNLSPAAVAACYGHCFAFLCQKQFPEFFVMGCFH